MTNLETSERTLAADWLGSKSRRMTGPAFERFAVIDTNKLRSPVGTPMNGGSAGATPELWYR
jgi:hypothetical protein